MKRPDWRQWRKLPEHLAHRLEAIHPNLAKHTLSYASRLAEWSLLGTSYVLEEWTDERVGLRLKPLTLGNVVSACEFMVKALLGRHFPLASEAVHFRRAEVEVLSGLDVTLQLRFELVAGEREAWLSEAQKKGQAHRELKVSAWSEQGRRLGEVLLEASMIHRPLLPPGG